MAEEAVTMLKRRLSSSNTLYYMLSLPTGHEKSCSRDSGLLERQAFSFNWQQLVGICVLIDRLT